MATKVHGTDNQTEGVTGQKKVARPPITHSLLQHSMSARGAKLTIE